MISRALRFVALLSLLVLITQCSTSTTTPVTAATNVFPDEAAETVLHCGKDIVIVEQVSPDKSCCLAWTVEAQPGKAPPIDWSSFPAGPKADWKSFFNHVEPGLFSDSPWQALEKYRFVGGIVPARTMAFNRLPVGENNDWQPYRNHRTIGWSKPINGVVYLASEGGSHFETQFVWLVSCNGPQVHAENLLGGLQAATHSKVGNHPVAQGGCFTANYEAFDADRSCVRFNTSFWLPRSETEAVTDTVKCEVDLASTKIRASGS